VARAIRARVSARHWIVVALVMTLMVGLVAAIPAPEPADAALPSGFTSTPVFSGLTLPTAMAFSPDGKVYVAEKSGVIKVFPNASSNNGVVFKDLSPRVFNFWDRGLLGITVDPRLGSGTGKDFVYALYAKDAPPGQATPRWNDDCPTPPGGLTDGCVVASTLSRIPVNANGTAGTEQILIDNEWCQQYTTHSAGSLGWGFDGSLYVTGGDGASYENADWGQFGGSLSGSPTPKNPCGDPPGGLGVANTSPTGRGGAMRSQSPRRPAGEPRVLGGTLLRINPDTGAGVPGNPFYSAATPTSNASRILAYGFRNPFRFTARPNTNEIWVADVGWGIYEEINRILTPTPTKAPNFGWPCLEKQTRLSGYRDLDMCKALYNDTVDPASDPYFTYEHGLAVSGNDTCGSGEDGSAITGAAFYNGNKYPSSYSNALFFADNSRNCIYVMTAGANGLPDTSTARTFVDNSDNPFPVDLKADPVSKDIFYVNIALGTVNRISYASTNRAPTAVASASPTSGAAPLGVTLNGSASSDPDGDSLTYSWDTDGNGSFGDATGVSPTVTYSTGGTYQARLLVTDPGGLTATSTQVTITVTSASGPVNTAPPTVSGTAQVGATLTSTTGTWTGTAPISYARQWQRCTTGSGTSYAAAVLANAPVAYWRLGETSGTTAADASGGGRSGTYAGGVVLGQAGALSGDANPAVSLDGANDNVIRNPIAGFPTTAISAELWVKTSDTTKEAGLVSYAASSSADEFQLRDARALRVYVKGSRVDTGIALNDGAWHHLAVTWASTGGALRVYKDGTLAYSNTVPVQAGTTLTAGGSLLLGQEQDTIGGGFETTQAYLGSLDEFALYPSVLTAAQVQAHRQAASGTGTGTSCTDIANATATTYSPQLVDQAATLRVRVTATNGGGTSSVASAAVGPVTGGGNTPPVPVINTPVSTLTWKAGDTVSFSGAATDAQDGNEPASRLSWSILLGHCSTTGCHNHPLATRPGVASGTIAAPDHEAPSYMELTLTATDAAGATASVVRRIDPQTVNLTFQTNPAGLSLAVGASQSAPAPFTQQWVVNSQVQLNAPTQQTVGATSYSFTGWSDGGASTHTINAPATNTMYTASYSGGTCTGTTYASAVTANTPLVYWRLGEATGTVAADASGNARPGTYVGGVGLAKPGALAGDANTSVLFDGANDNIVRNPIAGIGATAISTDFWLKTTNTKASGIVSYAATSSADEFQLRDPNALAVYVKGTRYNTGVVLNDGAWHHVAVTWSSAAGALRVYKDGALAYSNASPVKPGASLTTGGALVLGQEQDTVGGGFETSQAFLGNLDDVALYPSALTAAQVQAHRQAGISPGCPTGAQAAALSLEAADASEPRLVPGSELLPSLPAMRTVAGGGSAATPVKVALADHRVAFCPLKGGTV
jgi:glucose/arabinose dehydrogenase